jgi:hypothetical protein
MTSNFHFAPSARRAAGTALLALLAAAPLGAQAQGAAAPAAAPAPAVPTAFANMPRTTSTARPARDSSRPRCATIRRACTCPNCAPTTWW